MRFLRPIASAIFLALCVVAGLFAAAVAAVVAVIVLAIWRLTGRTSPKVTFRTPVEPHRWQNGNPINVTPVNEPAASQLK